MPQEKTVIAPRVHLNGDIKAELQGPIADAAHAIREAQIALRKTVPNARNYYVISDQAFNRARNEYIDRSERLQSVYEELAALFNAISEDETEASIHEYKGA